MSGPIDRVIAICRERPDAAVRYRLNGGDWRLSPSEEFLELWDQPFAGTIDVDCAYVPESVTPK
jgi:hypothetical protein